MAVPLATAVTRPDALTVATAAVLLAQVAVAPVIARPFWSRTSADSCTVAPSAVKSAVAGPTVIAVGRGGSGGGAVVVSGGGAVVLSPQAAKNMAVSTAIGAMKKGSKALPTLEPAFIGDSVALAVPVRLRPGITMSRRRPCSASLQAHRPPRQAYSRPVLNCRTNLRWRS